MSLIYAKDTQEIDDKTFGWHPVRGKDKYIQKRMGAIFASSMRDVFMIGNFDGHH